MRSLSLTLLVFLVQNVGCADTGPTAAEVAGGQTITDLVSEVVCIVANFDSLSGDRRNQEGMRLTEVSDDIVQLSRSNRYVGAYLVQQILHYAHASATGRTIEVRCMAQLASLLTRVDRTAYFETVKHIYVSGLLDSSRESALLGSLWNVLASQRSTPGLNDVSEEDMRGLFVQAVEDPDPDVRALARYVLFGRDPDGPYGPLDRELGEELIRNYIDEEANILEKNHLYQVLLTHGVASNEYVAFLRACVEDPDKNPGTRVHFAGKLHELGVLSDTELEQQRKRIEAEYRAHAFLRSLGPRKSPSPPLLQK